MKAVEISLGANIIDDIVAFIAYLRTIPEEEALMELRSSNSDTLFWILNDLAIPSADYDLASLIMQVMTERSY